VILYEFVHGGSGVLTKWRNGLEKAQRAQLDNKTDMLEVASPELLPGLVAGPIRKHPHIYKLQAGRKVRLRPLLCKGPKDKVAEITFLAGATERDWKLDPANAPEVAEARRIDLEANPNKRKSYETP